MSSLPTFDMIDTTQSILEDALRVCGLPLSLHQDAYEQIGAGAWHTAYKVTVPQQAHPFIVRIRKAHNLYGDPQPYEKFADHWHAEYVSTSLYYMQANRAQPGICPSIFLHHVSQDLTCTIETYMGTRLNLASLNAKNAIRFGRQIGSMMRTMHQKKTHIQGNGELAWDGANLYGTVPRRHPLLIHKIEQSYRENILLALTEQAHPFNHKRVEAKLLAANEIRNVDEPVVLINRDISPENLTIQHSGNIGIVDPYPYLGNATRFAAWFIHCYRFLIPVYAHTPRYRQNQWNQHIPILAKLAEGFERGYIQNDPVLASHIAAERWLWTLEQAYDDLERLQQDQLSESRIIKHGDRHQIENRLRAALHELETLDF